MIDQSHSKNKNGGNQQQQKKQANYYAWYKAVAENKELTNLTCLKMIKRVQKKEPQSNYIIIQTKKQQNIQQKAIGREPQEQQQKQHILKSELGIKQVQSQKVLNTSLKTLDSPLQSPMINQPVNHSFFANSPQNEKVNQNSMRGSQQNQQTGGYDYPYLMDYQYADIYNTYNPYQQYIEDNQMTPQYNQSDQEDKQSTNNQQKYNEISSISGQNSNYNLYDFRQSRIEGAKYIQQKQGQSAMNNQSLSHLAPSYAQQNSSYQQAQITANKIQMQIMSNTNKSLQFNHFVHLNNSSIIQLEQSQNNLQNTTLTMKQMSQLHQKLRLPYAAQAEEKAQVTQFNIKKRWEVFDLPFKNTIASLLTEKNHTFVYKFDPQGLNPVITIHKIDYKFPIIPSTNIAIDQKNGRLFMYDNNGNVLIFSQDLDFNQGKPLIKLSLEEQFPRKNPVLFLKSYETYTLLFVIGGFVKQQTVGEIKVFKIEKRNASIKFELTINTLHKRRNPSVFTYSIKSAENTISHKKTNNASTNQQTVEQQDEEKEYLILLGGNQHDSESESNITGEFIEMDKIHTLINKRNNLSVDIKNRLKVRLHSSFDDAYEISVYLTSSFVIVWDQQEEEEKAQKSKLLIFGEKIKNVLEIKKIDLGLTQSGDGIIDIIYTDILHIGHRGLMRIERDYLSFFDQKGKDVHILSLSQNIEVYSTKKKTNFFKPKKSENAAIQRQDEEEEELEDQEEEKDKVEIDLKSKPNKIKSKDSFKNLEAKDTKDQSQSLTEKKNINIEIPNQFLSNNNLQNENNPLQNEKKEQSEQEGEDEDKDDEEQSKSKKNKKDKKQQNNKNNVNSKRNKYICKCNVFQMPFFL